jgi:hypothetical protein
MTFGNVTVTSSSKLYMLNHDHALVIALFENHYNYYQTVGTETIKQQAGQVEQVSSDYQGRVIYELLQNAFDKALNKIKVIVLDGILYIANDGGKFTYLANYNYENGSENRGDFQALCSISTSEKDVNTSIGNKGVGFKSVFAVSDHGYADIHTIGEIFSDGESPEAAKISFRIYDSFKDSGHIPLELPNAPAEKLKLQITKANIGNRERGVPGYYYPILIEGNNDAITQLFDEDFVTVIQIPLSKISLQKVHKLFVEIQAVHFHFVQLRIDKPLSVTFNFDTDENLAFVKYVQNDKEKGNYISCQLKENVKELALSAGINILTPQVAVYLKNGINKNSGPGKLYNYLPTTIDSSFLMADFHADFHTTVDRTSINWELNVGAYNNALLEACLELYFICLNSYLDPENRITLNIKYLDISRLPDLNLSFFSWEFLTGNARLKSWETVRRILNLDNNYKIASSFIARIAKKYFDNSNIKSVEDYKSFFEKSSFFIDLFARYSGQVYQHAKDFKNELGKQLIDLDARIIPNDNNGSYSLQEELIYRENKREETLYSPPTFIGINIFGFRIIDEDFRKALKIKEFTDRNEILKYYRQVSPNGDYHLEFQFSELQQQELLLSIANLMGKINENIISTHRYANYLSRKTDNTTANLANFSISTLFLKTKNLERPYKPAQLCSTNELDYSFLPMLPKEISVETFLKYLGVSFADQYRFVDNPVIEHLQAGLNYIPALWKRPSAQVDPLAYENVVNEIRLIFKNKIYDPALINENQYPFLLNIKTNDCSQEAKLMLIRQYNLFPPAYFIRLRSVLENSLGQKESLLRLYQNIFERMLKETKTVLISQNGQLRFLDANAHYYLIGNESDFHLLHDKNIPVLCYYSKKLEEGQYDLKAKLISFKEREFHIGGSEDVTAHFQNLIDSKIFYLLLEISAFKESDWDFFDSPLKITELSRKLSSYRYVKVDKLEREIVTDLLEVPILDQRRYDSNEKCLYFRKNLSQSLLGEAISKVIFRNTRFARIAELILFHKSENALSQEYLAGNTVNYQTFKEYWINDYSGKFLRFSLLVLSKFNNSKKIEDDEWFRFNRLHQSSVILNADKTGEIELLKQIIIDQRENFEEGIFSDFKLDIDLEMYTPALARLQYFLGNEQGIAADNLMAKLNLLYNRVGIEDEIIELEKEILAEFPQAFTANISNQDLNKASQSVQLDAKIEGIFQSLKVAEEKQKKYFQAAGRAIVVSLPIKLKKVIFQGKELPTEGCEVTGASGEVEVLFLLIKHLLTLKPSLRIAAITAVNALIVSKLKNNLETLQKHDLYFRSALENVRNNEALTKALIPFYYITLHYKFAFIDLFGWYDNRAVMIEVKSTRNARKNEFTISGSEVNEAMANDNYIIVRVTAEAIIFLGNPIYDIKEKITAIKGSNFEIIPTGYNFKFVNAKESQQ